MNVTGNLVDFPKSKKPGSRCLKRGTTEPGFYIFSNGQLGTLPKHQENTFKRFIAVRVEEFV